MSEVAVRVEGISKRYRIGAAEARAESLAAAAARALRSPLRNLRRLRALTRFDGDGPDVLWALRDVSFEVARGEVLGVVGRNGAGKSTLLKVLSRIVEPTAGRAEIRGRVSSLLEVGTGFHPELTGRENVYLNGTLLGMRRAEVDRALDAIVEFAGVGAFVDTPVKRYSSGMTVRLAFAVAAHLEPDVLILDEVLAVGDASFRARSMSKMREAVGDGRTVLLVSHDATLVRELCDRCLLLDGGRAVLDGPTSEVLRAYEGAAAGTGEVRYGPDGPGSDAVRLRGVRVVGPDGRARDSVSGAEPVRIEVAYDVLREVPEVRVGLRLQTESGLVVAASASGGAGVEVPPPGSYVAAATVPAGLLNRLRYVVVVGAEGAGPLIPATAAVSFQVTGGSAAAGVVAPRLPWDVRRVGR